MFTHLFLLFLHFRIRHVFSLICFLFLFNPVYTSKCSGKKFTYAKAIEIFDVFIIFLVEVGSHYAMIIFMHSKYSLYKALSSLLLCKNNLNYSLGNWLELSNASDSTNFGYA